jgi:hypothetical protein
VLAINPITGNYQSILLSTFYFMGLTTLTILGLLTLEAVALAVAEVIHQLLLILLCVTLTGKCIYDDDR